MRCRVPSFPLVLATLATAMIVGAGAGEASGESTTILSPQSVGTGVESRHLKRARSSIRAAIKADSNLRSSNQSCGKDEKCIAAAGKRDGSDRALGIRVSRKNDNFRFDLMLVSTPGQNELAVHSFTVAKRELVTQTGALVLKFVTGAQDEGVTPAVETPKAAEKDTPIRKARTTSKGGLTLVVPKSVVGTGYTVVPIEVEGSPPPQTGELRKTPELPDLTCEGASTLPATFTRPPAILAPAVSKTRSVNCVVRHRGAEGAVTVEFTPPAKGLFATPDRYGLTVGERSVLLRVFKIGGKIERTLSVNVSAGRAELLDGGNIELLLPTGKSPRSIVVVFGDGKDQGIAVIPMIGKTKLRVVAQKKSSVVVRIAGKTFGPIVVAKRVSQVPIEVQPGARQAVVRSTDRRGYSIESVSDLKIPEQPRMTALSTRGGVVAEANAKIFVGLVDGDGRPALAGTDIEAVAKQGLVTSVTSVVPGLFALNFAAPKAAGEASISIKVIGDKRAGQLDHRIAVSAAEATGGELVLDRGPHLPGATVTGIAKFLDPDGNTITAGRPRATLGSKPITIDQSGDGFVFSAVIPKSLPKDLTLPVKVTLYGTVLSQPIQMGADRPVAVKFSSTTVSTGIRLSIRPIDKHGNLVDDSSFALKVQGATTGPLERKPKRFEVLLKPDKGRDSANVTIIVEGKELGRSRVVFGEAPGSIVLGAYARGAWASSFGGVSAPHLGLGVGLRRVGTSVEMSIFAGIEAFSQQESDTAMIAGAPQRIDRELTAIAVPIELRARLPFGNAWGVHAGVAFLPTRVRVMIDPEFQSADEYTEMAYGVRAHLGADFRLGPGRLSLSGAFARTQLGDELLTGGLEGASISLSYQWWLARLGQ